MSSLLRVALLACIGLLLVGTVVTGVGSDNTGVVEKVVLIVFGAALVIAAVRVQKLSRDQT